jgi:steroid delta-isomerase-like uncharacterized protein
MTATEVRDLVHRWMTLWQGADLSLVDELHADDFVDHSPADRSPDRAGVRAGLEELRRAFPDFHATSDDVIVDVDRATVAIRWRATGTHRGPFLGLASTGRVIEFQGIEVIRIDPSRGQIVEHWGEWDGLGLVEQLRGRR